MQIKSDEFLPIAEKAGALAFVDIEASNLAADYGTVVVVSIKSYKGEPRTFTCRPGRDKALLKRVVKELEKYQVWVTFYGKMFDIPFIKSRLVRHGLPTLPKKHHVDLYWVIRYHTAVSRRSQAHLLEWLEAPEKKMSISANIWAELPTNTAANLKVLAERCESDVKGLEELYEKTKHLIGEISR